MASFTFISHVGFSTTILALVLDSLVRVSRRVGKNHFGKIAQGPSSRRTPGQHAPGQAPSRTASGIRRLHLASLAHPSGPLSQASQGPPPEFISTGSASTISSLLTLSPECFSSFLHSTCSLSVSYVYLALEEVYLPLCALVSKYATLRRLALAAPRHRRRGSHPLWRPPRRHFCVWGTAWTGCLQITIRRAPARRLPLWAFPASVARTEGILVSFFSSA